jgi:parallel beta-helix repeat protein
MYLLFSSPIVANNTITGNSVQYDGGGIFVDFTSGAMIANNTVTGNGAFGGGGGGIFLENHSSPTITNTIIAFNSAGISRGYFGGVPTLRFNCVYGNKSYDYGGLTDPTGTAGNISDDPVFVQNPHAGSDGEWGTPDDDFGNLQLQSGSPCIDAGDNDAVPTDYPDLDNDGDTSEPLPFDLAGLPRFVDDPSAPDTGAGMAPIVDMGAYEYQPDVLSDLEDAVLALGLPHGIERSLLAKLATASRVLEDDSPRNDVASCNALRAFIHSLKARGGKHIPETEVAALVEMAHQALALLGCSETLRRIGRDVCGAR